MNSTSGSSQQDIEQSIAGLAEAVKAAAELLKSLAPVVAEIRALQQALGEFEGLTGSAASPVARTGPAPLREVAR